MCLKKTYIVYFFVYFCLVFLQTDAEKERQGTVVQSSDAVQRTQRFAGRRKSRQR